MGGVVTLPVRRRAGRPPAPADRVDLAMELHAAVRELRVRHAAPLWEHVLATGSWEAMGECQDIAELLRTAERKAKRITAALAATGCGDGFVGPSHGRAA